MARGKARIDIESRFDGKGTKDAEQALSRLHSVGSKSLTGLKVAGLAAGGAVGIGLAAAVATGTREMLEQEKAAAQTAARLKSTGEAANVTAKQIEGMASALQAQTGIADDQIQSMQNLLLTFTNVRNEAGRNNDVFNRATKVTLDLSVAFGKDLNSSAVLVGKALNDPIKGLTALNRVGVQFTKDQKEQIKTLVESGKALDAQKIILRELSRETGGSAKAFGDTTAGQLERVKRAWEDTSEALTRAFLPVINRLARVVLEKMPEIQRAFAWLGRKIEQGKWGEIGAKVGKALIDGLAAGINAAVLALRDRLPGGRNGVLAQVIFGDIRHFTIPQLVPTPRAGSINPLTGTTSVPEPSPLGRPRGGPGGGLATGGVVPGPYTGRDDRSIRVGGGEIVLRPDQARIVGIDRIMDTLRRTGGRIGGDGFASGGVVGGAVAAASAFARAQVGEPYVWGAGHSYGDSRGWDCSGFASNVAARVPGYTGGIGTTMTLYPKSRAEGPAPANAPIAFGFNGMSINDPRKQHMGVRVDGVWYDAGSGGVQTGRSSWDSGVWIPPGLGGLTSGGGPDPGPARAPDQPTPLQRLTRLLGRTGAFKDNTAGAGLAARRILSSVPDFSGSTPGASLTSGQERAQAGAGRTARERARAAGLDPDQVAAAGEAAERDAEVRFLNRNLLLAKEDMDKLGNRKAKLLGDLRRIQRSKNSKPGAKRAAARQIRLRLREITAEMNDLREVVAEVQARLADIGEQVVEEQYQARYDAEQERASAAPGASDTAAAGPTPDQQAALDQANARALAAQQNAAGSEAFLKTLRESASIDPGMGGRPIVINVEGSLVRYGELAAFVTGALGQQGAPVPGVFASAA